MEGRKQSTNQKSHPDWSGSWKRVTGPPFVSGRSQDCCASIRLTLAGLPFIRAALGRGLLPESPDSLCYRGLPAVAEHHWHPLFSNRCAILGRLIQGNLHAGEGERFQFPEVSGPVQIQKI